MLRFGYGFIVLIILYTIRRFISNEDHSVIDAILAVVSLFIGSFIYTQRHGIQVSELRHLGFDDGNAMFHATLYVNGKVSNVVGGYSRHSQYDDLELQAKLFKILNTSPTKERITQFSKENIQNFEVAIFENGADYTMINCSKWLG
jgi:hypothetical protein